MVRTAALNLTVLGLAALGLGVIPAAAGGHPVRPVEARQAAARRAAANHRVVQDVPAGRTARPGRGKSRKGAAAQSKAAEKRADRPAAKSRRHRMHPKIEPDDDAVVLHRAGARNSKTHPRRGAVQQATAARSLKAEEASTDARKSPTPKTPAPRTPVREAPDRTALPLAELEREASPAEEDDTLPPAYRAVGVGSSVSAAPQPVTPAGKASLPEKLHAAAARAETAVKADAVAARESLAGRGRTKPSVLPEEHAEKAAVIEQAMTPMILPTLYTRHGRLIVPPPLKGSREILVHQNTMADTEGLDRIQNDDDLEHLRELGLLVPLRASGSLLVNEALPSNRRYARPWAARFASDMGRAFYARFRQPLRLNSAVRTVEYQLRLQRVNGNAAAVNGDGASPHLTGQALDFGKRGMSVAQIAWMRAYLVPLMKAGKVDVEEEFQQACFHVSVYRSYVPAVKPKPKLEVAQGRGELAVAATASVAIR